MYQLTHNGHPVGKPHPHRITCYIEALEAGFPFNKYGNLQGDDPDGQIDAAIEREKRDD